jgi:hypothetical protein
MRHLGMSISEIYNLPVTYRDWFVTRSLKDINDRAESARASQNSSPRVKTMEVPFGAMNKD